MIEFTDMTMREARGNYGLVSEIMSQERTDGTWMLRTDCFVSTSAISCGYLLHAWSDKRIVIKGTDHPTLQEAPDDDIRELSTFVQNQGWSKLGVSDELLDDTGSFDFWLRMYQSGVVESDLLKKYDDDEMSRLAAAYEAEQEQEDAY